MNHRFFYFVESHLFGVKMWVVNSLLMCTINKNCQTLCLPINDFSSKGMMYIKAHFR